MVCNLLGVPIKDNGKIKPTPGVHADFGHVNAPELIWSVGNRFRLCRTAFCFKSGKRRNKHIMFFHNTVYAFSVNRNAMAVFEVSPDAAIATEGMIVFDFGNLAEQRLVSLDNRKRFFTFHNSFSVFLTR